MVPQYQHDLYTIYNFFIKQIGYIEGLICFPINNTNTPTYYAFSQYVHYL